MLRWIEHVLAGFGLLILVSLLVILGTFVTVPTHNTKLEHFDAILVLGSPALLNGHPSPEERERVSEGVREFKAGRAPHMIFTGGPTENQFTEGLVMAKLAEEQGVPGAAITVEGQAQNTIQNIYFSNRILQQKGWTSVEVVSSPSHLPRTGLILKQYHLQWREHAAHWPPEYDWKKISMIYIGEISETFLLRWHGFTPSPFLPSHFSS